MYKMGGSSQGVCMEGRSPQFGSSTNFYVFLHKICEFHKYRSRDWTVFFVHKQLKKNEDLAGSLNPHNFTSRYIRGFFLVQTTWDLGDNYGKMHTII